MTFSTPAIDLAFPYPRSEGEGALGGRNGRAEPGARRNSLNYLKAAQRRGAIDSED